MHSIRIKSCEFSEAAKTVRTQTMPISGKDITESNSNVRKLPKPRMWSLSVKADLMHMKRMNRLMIDIPEIGPTNHQTTGS